MAGLGPAGLLEGKSSLPDTAAGLPSDTESPRCPGLKFQGSQYWAWITGPILEPVPEIHTLRTGPHPTLCQGFLIQEEPFLSSPKPCPEEMLATFFALGGPEHSQVEVVL